LGGYPPGTPPDPPPGRGYPTPGLGGTPQVWGVPPKPRNLAPPDPPPGRVPHPRFGGYPRQTPKLDVSRHPWKRQNFEEFLTFGGYPPNPGIHEILQNFDHSWGVPGRAVLGGTPGFPGLGGYPPNLAKPGFGLVYQNGVVPGLPKNVIGLKRVLRAPTLKQGNPR
jgi:hypothetical protein